MWLAAVEPDLIIALAAAVTSIGGVSLPFLIPLATKRVKALERLIVELTSKVEECERERKQDRQMFAELRRGSRGRR